MSDGIINLQLILDFMDKHKLSRKEFCKKCNISEYMFCKIMKNDGDYGVTNLIKVIDFMGIKMVEIINKNYKR